VSPTVEAALIAVVGTVVVAVAGFWTTRSVTGSTLAEQRTPTLNERFATAADQLGSEESAAVRLAGVYAMAGLADDWVKNRQTCVDVLCAYLRLPYQPDPGQDAPESERLAFQGSREVRHTVTRVIAEHLRGDAGVSWQGLNFDFRGVVFDGGDFRKAVFSRGLAVFDGAKFSGGEVRFDGVKFSGGIVFFGGAKFSGGPVRFDRAEFSGGWVSFRKADLCGGKVRFHRAKFSGGTTGFDGAKFSSSPVDFSDAEFSGAKVDFSGALDWSRPPEFSWTGPPPPGVKLPET